MGFGAVAGWQVPMNGEHMPRTRVNEPCGGLPGAPCQASVVSKAVISPGGRGSRLAHTRTARTRGGSEVDFVLYGAAGFHAIEVKNGRSLRPADLRGIKELIPGRELPS